MNCKPGDLAWIVRVGPNTKKQLGRMVTVTTIATGLERPAWHYEGPMLKADDGTWHIAALEDCCLKPHRPGDLNETTDERKEVTA